LEGTVGRRLRDENDHNPQNEKRREISSGTKRGDEEFRPLTKHIFSRIWLRAPSRLTRISGRFSGGKLPMPVGDRHCDGPPGTPRHILSPRFAAQCQRRLKGIKCRDYPLKDIAMFRHADCVSIASDQIARVSCHRAFWSAEWICSTPTKSESQAQELRESASPK
jgi:hypothetical protein